jgi:hypothetical protein
MKQDAEKTGDFVGGHEETLVDLDTQAEMEAI